MTIHMYPVILFPFPIYSKFTRDNAQISEPITSTEPMISMTMIPLSELYCRCVSSA